MNLLRDSKVREYIKSRTVISNRNALMVCQCFENLTLKDSHNQNASSISTNLAELAATFKQGKVRHIVMYITKISYFNSDMLKFLANEMLECKENDLVEQYFTVLDQNFRMHPPCASYMKSEYDQFLLSPYRKCFNEMSLWEYIMDSFNRILNGSLELGNGSTFDLALKRCLRFCVSVLEVDLRVCKNNNSRAIIMNCLNYHPGRRTRMSDICKILDKLFLTGYDIQMEIINLAILISDMMSE
ncbi:uncharacterized protein LOC126905142 isoform X2 [Daktulosphaira vitifoliae]|nr:uncharacterized protein LOC126905142 isoform X2 [Daktulosphaira vitifoliae]XP_050540549.1 uncharacterized protein LOC126905142 isoform X2 [Daktulosphaira vitifoliae]